MAGIAHHTSLRFRGGAVRVAQLLHQGLPGLGRASRCSFEIDESDPEAGSGSGPGLLDAPADGTLVGPEALAASLAPGEILHLHSSTDLPGLLARLPDGLRLVLTLHDVTALTGGCAYPLSCPHFPPKSEGATTPQGLLQSCAAQPDTIGCADPCPRDFFQAGRVQALLRQELARLAPVLVCPSRWMAAQARAALPQADIRILPNGVPWPELGALTQQGRARQALGIAAGARVALFAAHGGVRAAYKSGPHWTAYWRSLKAALPEALGFAVGGDQSGREGDLVTWPYVDRARLALLMRAADCLVYPTLADNHPLVLLEAAAQELAVVSYEVGGVPEIVSHGVTGLLAPAGDQGLLTESALVLLASPLQARALGRAAYARGRTRFPVQRMLSDHYRIYGELLA